MREILFDSKDVIDEYGDELKLRYYIIVSSKDLGNGGELESYGVKIVMTKNDSVEEEIAEIDDIFVNSLEIDELIMLLFRCTVTPISLYEVMDDYLAR